MKEQLRSILENYLDPLQKRNIIREYLQAKILSLMQSAGGMVYLAFYGGTALRFLYQLPRFSEDLDFTLEKPHKEFKFSTLIKNIQNGLSKEGYLLNVKVNDTKTVHSALIKFTGLLYEYDLSRHMNETFSIKIEVDTNPPKGAVLETRIVRKYVPLNLQHHDKSSLFAGKIHSVLQRSYVKGRDFYDFVWYLGDPVWPEPNFILLNHALKQTSWTGELLSSLNWRDIIAERIKSLNLEEMGKDVGPFLENYNEIQLITKENILHLLTFKK